MAKILEIEGELKNPDLDKFFSLLEKKGLTEGVHYECSITGGGDARNVSILVRAAHSEIFLKSINEDDLSNITKKLTVAK